MLSLVCRVFQVLLLSVFLFITMSCTSKNSEMDKTIRIAIAAEPKTLDPRFATDAAGMRISNLLFNSLVRLGPELKIINDGAESHEYENLRYSFVLRPGLKFHHGRMVTPDDVLFTFKEYQSGRSPFRSALQVIDSVKAEEKQGKIHVAIQLKQFSATFLNDLTPVKILPKDIVEEQGDDFARRPVGSGVFKIADRNNNEITLQRHSGHPLGDTKSEKVQFKIVRDDTTRVLKLRSGEIDLVQNEIPPSKVGSFEGMQNFSVYKFPGLSMSYLLINLRDPVLKKPQVREAIARAINREEIIKYKLNGLAQKASSILTPSSPFFFEAKNFSFDLSSATALIQSLGVGKESITLKTSNGQTAVQNGQILAEQISKLNLNVKLESFEWGTFYSDIQKGNFQLATMRWIGATDPDIYRIAFHSGELPPKGRNRGHYINQKLDQLLTNGIKIQSPKARVQHYHEVQRIVQADLPIIPLWYDKQVAIVRKEVKGFTPPLNGDYTPLTQIYK